MKAKVEIKGEVRDKSGKLKNSFTLVGFTDMTKEEIEKHLNQEIENQNVQEGDI